jgi:hypothetical protein
MCYFLVCSFEKVLYLQNNDNNIRDFAKVGSFGTRSVGTNQYCDGTDLFTLHF